MGNRPINVWKGYIKETIYNTSKPLTYFKGWKKFTIPSLCYGG